jgi:hypothetical protein
MEVTCLRKTQRSWQRDLSKHSRKRATGADQV